MRRTDIAISLGLLAGCSFIDDYDKFRISESVQDEDAGRPDGAAGGDAGRDASEADELDARTKPDADGPLARDGEVALDADVADSVDASPDAAPSDAADAGDASMGVCGDGVIDRARGETCDDRNDVAGDGCEPVTCTETQACGGVPCTDNDPCTRDMCEGSACRFVAIDRDGDGYAPAVCAATSSVKGGDCDDNNRNRHPGVAEICDDIDNDCNGRTDDGITKILCYPDRDGDGFANLDGTVRQVCDACPKGTLAVADPTDRKAHDCWDDPGTRGEYVYPGQMSYFEEGYGPGVKNERKWDYDCDGRVEAEFDMLTVCAGLLGLLCDSAMGFVEEPPPCGEGGMFQMCRQSTLSCNGTTQVKRQTCR